MEKEVTTTTTVRWSDLETLIATCDSLAAGDWPSWLGSIQSSASTSLRLAVHGLVTSTARHHDHPVGTIQTEDLWAAIDALDAIPSTHTTDWYKRLVEAADASTLVMAAESGWVTKQ